VKTTKLKFKIKKKGKDGPGLKNLEKSLMITPILKTIGRFR